jgi:hypothetical protein
MRKIVLYLLSFLFITVVAAQSREDLERQRKQIQQEIRELQADAGIDPERSRKPTWHNSALIQVKIKKRKRGHQ